MKRLHWRAVRLPDAEIGFLRWIVAARRSRPPRKCQLAEPALSARRAAAWLGRRAGVVVGVRRPAPSAVTRKAAPSPLGGVEGRAPRAADPRGRCPLPLQEAEVVAGPARAEMPSPTREAEIAAGLHRGNARWRRGHCPPLATATALQSNIGCRRNQRLPPAAPGRTKLATAGEWTYASTTYPWPRRVLMKSFPSFLRILETCTSTRLDSESSFSSNK